MRKIPLPPVPARSYFYTLRLADRSGDLLLRHVEDLRAVLRDVKILRPFRIDAITVLPSALHMLWTLPPGDDDPDRRLALIMSRFAQALPAPRPRPGGAPPPDALALWQRRPWRQAIADRDDFLRHRDLIWLSPVQEGLCHRPEDWRHTSLHAELRQDLPAPLAPPPAFPDGGGLTAPP